MEAMEFLPSPCRAFRRASKPQSDVESYDAVALVGNYEDGRYELGRSVLDLHQVSETPYETRTSRS